MASRIIVRFELKPSAKKALETVTEKKGMTQTALFSRLVEWFAKQPDAVQAAALSNDHSETEAATSKLIVQQLISGKKK